MPNPSHIPPAALEAVARVREAIRVSDLEQARVLYYLVCSLEEFAFQHLYVAVIDVTPPHTVTASVKPDPESRLLTASEAASLCGPSFSSKQVYRLKSSMPEQAWVRKGGRLYFREGPFRRWLATR